MSSTLPDAWRARLGERVSSAFDAATDRVELERAKSEVLPVRDDVFAAFALTPPDAVRVVVIGQDPYHGPGQAHGLAFSVPRGTPLPPSLRNIFKELQLSGAVQSPPLEGDLSRWARQGVLLLNTSLVVRAGEAASLAQIGFFEPIREVVAAVDRGPRPVAFVLWGAHAQKVAHGVDRSRHLVLDAPHPSPLSAHRGFLGCGHFVAINRWLTERGESPIDWKA
jgi:uracil-DNA glycosylase